MSPTVPNQPPEREPLPAVDSWATMTDAEMLEHLRTAAITVDDIPADVRARMEVRIGDVFRQEGVTGDEARAGLARLRADAMTDDAEVLAAMLEPEPVHYDPDIMVRLSPCGLDLHELAREDVTTDPAKVTCPVCSASLVNGQLPPEPVAQAYGEFREPACPHGYEAEQYCEDCTPPAQPERRTVGLEVLTDELRQAADTERTAENPDYMNSGGRAILNKARVALVFREGGLVSVTAVDSDWANRTPPLTLALLLQQGGYLSDVELLMPTPDVLAAMAGTAVARYTVALEMSYGTVPPGSYVRTEVEVAPGHRETAWQLLTGRRDCTDPDCTAVETGQPDCRVVTVEGRGEQHVARWWPVSARVPASTEVEQP